MSWWRTSSYPRPFACATETAAAGGGGFGLLGAAGDFTNVGKIGRSAAGLHRRASRRAVPPPAAPPPAGAVSSARPPESWLRRRPLRPFRSLGRPTRRYRPPMRGPTDRGFSIEGHGLATNFWTRRPSTSAT